MRYVLVMSMVAMALGCEEDQRTSFLPAASADAGAVRDAPSNAGGSPAASSAAGSGAISRANAGTGGSGAASNADRDAGTGAGRAAGSGGTRAAGGAASPVPPAPRPAPSLDDAGVPGSDVDVEVAVDCSFELSACVLRKLPVIDDCIDAFSTCGGLVESTGDAGPDAVCALQFSACVLDDVSNLDGCIDAFDTCRKEATPPG